ncbi:LytR/AlgR family response regulator transcription factor [Oleiharenicola lentus]|uniref:LytR/AlgR family response regulator transcription factor n=1 Tax=Oleiharenicola lentus TaxID=2508720 RepID=UPI003F67D05B
MPKVLLIDDEAPAREDLRRLLAAHPEVTIVGEAGSIASARIKLAEGGYDLVFLDVQLVGGTGFDLVPAILPDARVIFVTAYDQHAMRAFEVNALDYLLKPVRRERLNEALRRVATALPREETHYETSPRPVLRADDVIHVKTGRAAARFVRLADIVTLTSEDNYSMLLLGDGTSLLVRETLSSWETRLPATHFLRVHRQVIVNLLRIEGFSHEDDRITLLRVTGAPEPVRARREHWSELTARLAALGRPLV